MASFRGRNKPLSGEMRIKDKTAWAQHLDEIITIGASAMISTTDDPSRLRAVRALMTQLKRFVLTNDRTSKEFLAAVGYKGNPKDFSPDKLPWAQVEDLDEVIWKRWEACQDLIVRRGLGPTSQYRERVG